MNIKTDGIVRHPLGGASYMFEKEIIPYLLKQLTKDHIKISVGAQVNSSPHFGTLITIALSYELALQLEKKSNKKASILYEIIETVPGEESTINGLKYQKNLEASGEINKYLDEYIEILNHYSKITGIEYEIRYQSEFNNSKEIYPIIKNILNHREFISSRLDPKYNNLRVRSSCPKCGLTDKHSVKNEYIGDYIYFMCPVHGKYRVNFITETHKLEYNSPLRNLIRGIFYSTVNNSDDYDYQILRVTGSDYAGFYQEEMRYKLASHLGYDVSKMSFIFYAPLIMDWSGAKMSKSLYVKKGAYNDIPQEFINYHLLKNIRGIESLNTILKIVETWFENPYMLFRNYTIYYFIKEFQKYE